MMKLKLRFTKLLLLLGALMLQVELFAQPAGGGPGGPPAGGTPPCWPPPCIPADNGIYYVIGGAIIFGAFLMYKFRKKLA